MEQKKTSDIIKDDEFYLDSEDYWKNDFSVVYDGLDKSGKEIWKVTSSYTAHKHPEYCSSMEEAFRVAYTGQEMIDDLILSIKDTSIMTKALCLIVNVNWKYSASHIDRDTKKVVQGGYTVNQWRNILFDAKIPDYMESRHQTKLQLMHENNTYTDVSRI